MKATPVLRILILILLLMFAAGACWILNDPPVIISLTASTQEVGPGGTVTLT